MNILNKIAATKRIEVESAKALLPPEILRDIIREYTIQERSRTPLSLKRSVKQASTGIIAEFKRKSPSKGAINPSADVATTIKTYEKGGAAGCSVLTDTPFFGGSLTDLNVARRTTNIPLLRKDFIIDPYQILQAKIHGADAILLIASLLDYHKVGEFSDIAHEYEMEVLLELHTPEECDRYFSEIDLVGVNSRNLSDFVTNIVVAEKMVNALPDNAVKIAESGIKSPEDIKKLKEKGYDGFLIGEMLMKAANPEALLREITG